MGKSQESPENPESTNFIDTGRNPRVQNGTVQTDEICTTASSSMGGPDTTEGGGSRGKEGPKNDLAKRVMTRSLSQDQHQPSTSTGQRKRSASMSDVGYEIPPKSIKMGSSQNPRQHLDEVPTTVSTNVPSIAEQEQDILLIVPYLWVLHYRWVVHNLLQQFMASHTIPVYEELGSGERANTTRVLTDDQKDIIDNEIINLPPSEEEEDSDGQE